MELTLTKIERPKDGTIILWMSDGCGRVFASASELANYGKDSDDTALAEHLLVSQVAAKIRSAAKLDDLLQTKTTIDMKAAVPVSITKVVEAVTK